MGPLPPTSTTATALFLMFHFHSAFRPLALRATAPHAERQREARPRLLDFTTTALQYRVQYPRPRRAIGGSALSLWIDDSSAVRVTTVCVALSVSLFDFLHGTRTTRTRTRLASEDWFSRQSAWPPHWKNNTLPAADSDADHRAQDVKNRLLVPYVHRTNSERMCRLPPRPFAILCIECATAASCLGSRARDAFDVLMHLPSVAPSAVLPLVVCVDSRACTGRTRTRHTQFDERWPAFRSQPAPLPPAALHGTACERVSAQHDHLLPPSTSQFISGRHAVGRRAHTQATSSAAPCAPRCLASGAHALSTGGMGLRQGQAGGGGGRHRGVVVRRRGRTPPCSTACPALLAISWVWVAGCATAGRPGWLGGVGGHVRAAHARTRRRWREQAAGRWLAAGRRPRRRGMELRQQLGDFVRERGVDARDARKVFGAEGGERVLRIEPVASSRSVAWEAGSFGEARLVRLVRGLVWGSRGARWRASALIGAHRRSLALIGAHWCSSALIGAHWRSSVLIGAHAARIGAHWVRSSPSQPTCTSRRSRKNSTSAANSVLRASSCSCFAIARCVSSASSWARSRSIRFSTESSEASVRPCEEGDSQGGGER